MKSGGNVHTRKWLMRFAQQPLVRGTGGPRSAIHLDRTSPRATGPSLIGAAQYGAVRRVVWDPGANHSRGPDWALVCFVFLLVRPIPFVEKNPSRNGRTIRSQNATQKRAKLYAIPIHAVVIGKCDAV
jgi:hypothetical protein